MDDNLLINSASLVGASGIGAVLFGIFARFGLRKMTEEGTATVRASAETDVIEVLRAEIDRLAKLNSSLSDKVGNMQQGMIELREENAELHRTVLALKAEIASMRDHGVCFNCPFKEPKA